MRVSAIPSFCNSLEETVKLARWSAEISHNHPEGIKGVECTAGMIYLAKTHDKKAVKWFAEKYYNLIPLKKQSHIHNETCQDTMPKAIQCFLEAHSFEETIRNAIWVGDDTDTIAAIA